MRQCKRRQNVLEAVVMPDHMLKKTTVFSIKVQGPSSAGSSALDNDIGSPGGKLLEYVLMLRESCCQGNK